MCACTEPVETGIGDVCVEYGRPKWPITMLNLTDIPGTEYPGKVWFLFLAPYARTTRYEEAFLPKAKKRTRSLRSLGLASLFKKNGRRYARTAAIRKREKNVCFFKDNIFMLLYAAHLALSR